ncbi:hypothetical protein C8N47_101275 [Mangrovibacterium marinum]|uniref:Uncharacterized protein n=1 Tax=Mangrovibacterium marinum TaxID=1639118 RepID=A0A2T5C6P4_9BACT|nr:hypothetical protein C8N47_101275 [Mangrovibacterium marinum]
MRLPAVGPVSNRIGDNLKAVQLEAKAKAHFVANLCWWKLPQVRTVLFILLLLNSHLLSYRTGFHLWLAPKTKQKTQGLFLSSGVSFRKLSSAG